MQRTLGQYGPGGPWKRNKHLSASERFIKFIICDVETGCWEWLGAQNGVGYGVFRANGKKVYAHRFCYQTRKGHLPPSPLELDHLCRNRSCVNPNHLEPVTKSVNQLRSPLVVARRKELCRAA